MIQYSWPSAAGHAVLLIGATLATPHAGAEPDVWFSISGETRSGSYGLDEPTDEYRVALDASVTFDRLTLYANLPYISVDGPAGAAPTSTNSGFSGFSNRGGLLSDRRPLQGSDDDTVDEDETANGLGDSLIGTSLMLTDPWQPGWLSIFADAVLPTGDEEAELGTGTSDYSIGTNAGYTLAGTTLSITGGYTFVGDADDDASTLDTSEDYAFASLGLEQAFGTGIAAGTGLNWAEAEDGEDPPLSLYLNTSLPLGDRVSLLGYGQAGLTDASADYIFGLGLSLPIGN